MEPFHKKDSGRKCKYCHQEIKTKGNTTNLRNRLLRRHLRIKTVSLKKKSESGGGNCSNARNGDGQISGACISYITSFLLQCTEFEENRNYASILQSK